MIPYFFSISAGKKEEKRGIGDESPFLCRRKKKREKTGSLEKKKKMERIFHQGPGGKREETKRGGRGGPCLLVFYLAVAARGGKKGKKRNPSQGEGGDPYSREGKKRRGERRPSSYQLEKREKGSHL